MHIQIYFLFITYYIYAHLNLFFYSLFIHMGPIWTGKNGLVKICRFRKEIRKKSQNNLFPRSCWLRWHGVSMVNDDDMMLESYTVSAYSTTMSTHSKLFYCANTRILAIAGPVSHLIKHTRCARNQPGKCQ